MPTSSGRLALFFEKHLEPGLTDAWTAITITQSAGHDVQAEGLWFGNGHTAEHHLGIPERDFTLEALQELAAIRLAWDAHESTEPQTATDEAGALLLAMQIVRCAGALVVGGTREGLEQVAGTFNALQTLGTPGAPQEV